MSVPMTRSAACGSQPPEASAGEPNLAKVEPLRGLSRGRGFVRAGCFSHGRAFNLKAPNGTVRGPHAKAVTAGLWEAMLTIGPGRIKASFHQSRSFPITDATRLCGALWITEAQGTRRNDYRTC